MVIQSGQVLQQVSSGISTGRTEPKQTGTLQTGRVVRGISTYDERIRQGIISDIAGQKEAYESEIARQKAEIDRQNAEIEAQNALLKASYDKAVDDIKNMTVEEYNSYYYTIPSNLRDLFQTPQQIQEQLIIDKQNRATETSNAIDDIINKQIERQNYYLDLVNKATDPNLRENYDRQAVEYGIKADVFRELKVYATGDYDKTNILMYGWELADTRINRNWESVDAGRLNKLEESKLVEEYKTQGLEPVYKYPNSQLQTLIGFTPTGTKPDTSSFYNPIVSTTSKIIPQSKLSPTLSQQYLEQPISYQQKSKNPFDFIFNQNKSSIGKDNLGQPITKRQLTLEEARGNLVLTKATSISQIFKKTAKEQGYVKGTLSFLGERLGGLYDIAVQKGYTSPERQESIRTLLKLSPSAVYFTPVAPTLMAIGGTETIIKGKTIKEKLFGAGEAILGFIGLKSQLGSLKSISEIAKFEKAPTMIVGARVEGEAGGLDILYGKKVVGKNVYESFIQQPFKYVGEEGKIVAEGGKGLATKYYKGLPKEIMSFETGGRTIPIETTPKITSIREGFTITRPIEAESSASRIYTKTKFKGELEQKGINYFATGKEISAKPTYETYIGFGKEKNNLIKFVAGKAEKARMNLVTGEKTIIGKPSTFGVIKRIVPSTEEGFSIIRPSIKNIPDETVKLFHGTTESGAKSALETGLIPKEGFKEVYLVEPKDIEFAKGFAGRSAISKGEGIKLLEANIPKSEYELLKVSRATGKGGMSEITLKNVPKQYLKVYEETPIETYQGKDLLQLLVKPKQKADITTIGIVEKSVSLFKPVSKKPSKSLKLIGMEEFTKPSYVSGGEVGQPLKSEYYGKGNVFEDVEYLVPITPSKEAPKISATGTLLFTPKSSKYLIGQIPRLKQPLKEETRPRLKQPSQPKYKQPQLFKQPQLSKQPQRYKQPEIFKTPQATKQPEVFKQPTQPRTPKIIPVFNESKLSKKQVDVLTKAFTVLIRSKGKVQEIGKGLPYGKALKLGVEKSKSSLAQTFALRETGTTRGTDISYRVPANLFTQPKRAKTRITPLTFVERRGKTLTHYPEVSGIQREKKIKQRKLRWL